MRGLAALHAGGQGRLVVAHCNHQLRATAAAEAAFVAALCRQLGLLSEVGLVTVPLAAGDGLEAAARHARYHFLEAAAGRYGARYVVTAHTADDQAETVLQRILRGTGLGGLAGMPRVRPLGPASLLRPLLGCRRPELRAYLEELGQAYCCDESNQDLAFHAESHPPGTIAQLGEAYHPRVVENLLRLATLAGEMQGVIDALVAELRERAVRVEPLQPTARQPAGAVEVDGRALASVPVYLLRELLLDIWRRQGWPEQDMGFQQWDLLAGMLRGGTPRKQMFPGGVLAEDGPGGLRLSLA